MGRIWLKHYPVGVAAEVDLQGLASINELLSGSCRRFADLPAYSNMGKVITYADLDRLSRAFAAYLQQTLGLMPGDRLALMMPNLLQYPVALFGALRAGLVVVNVNPLYTVPELAHQLKDSGAVAIVVLENFAHTLQTVLVNNPHMRLAVVTTEVGDLLPAIQELITNVVVKYVKRLVPDWSIPDAVEFNEALRTGQDLGLVDVAIGPNDPAFLQYTGGTTGQAKGALLTHGNLVANVQQLSAWIATGLREGEEVFVCPLPMYHIYALNSCLVFLKIGAHTVLVTNPRDLSAFIHDLRRQPFSVIIGVNTLYRALLDSSDFESVDTSHLKLANAGGMAVQRVVAERWMQATGVPLIESYGLTEASPGVMSNPLGLAAWSGHVGMPLPSTDAVILDDAGRELPIGEVGEICVRGPQVMAGYWHRPDESAAIIDRTGWLHTGDMGAMDERGSFSITDRKKDMIIVSGFKVFPNQVEDAVALHLGVAEVGAVGMPDEHSGEVVKIVVVRRDASLTEEALLAHCRQHLTGYKVPRIVEFRSEPLPRSNLGKILRRQLRQDAAMAAVD